MNGFKILADSYRKAAELGEVEKEWAESKCKALDFLATCEEEDFYNLFDSAAFNDIMFSYVRNAVNNIESLTDEQRKAIREEVRLLVSERNAAEIVKR